jgi:hypothetical protein
VDERSPRPGQNRSYEVGVDQQRRIEEGRTIRALGEQAALEVLERFMSSNPQAEALLLFEDSDIARRRAIVDERVSLISTGDFLRELEAARLIQSADYILEQAARSGRNVERQHQVTSDGDTRSRFRRQLQRTDDDPRTQ